MESIPNTSNPFAARLRRVLDHHEITAYKLGKEIGYSNAAIGNMRWPPFNGHGSLLT
jgi:hypothetical protein